jgi:hypothetical protein
MIYSFKPFKPFRFLRSSHTLAAGPGTECFIAHTQSTHTIVWQIVHCMAKYLPRLKFSDLGLGQVCLGLGLGTVSLGLDLGLGRPGPDDMAAEIQARRTASTEHGIAKISSAA